MWFRLLVGPLLANRTRVLLSVLAIALGVALGYAIALINRAAIDEFGQAVRVLSGESDLTVRGAQRGFSESVCWRSVRVSPALAMTSTDAASTSWVSMFSARRVSSHN